MKCAACQKDVLTGKFCSECGALLATKPRFGDYEVNEVIGEGGMGRVFKAMQPRLKRAVCVKTLLPQFAKDEALKTRFEREATTTAALQHPNIVSIIDVGRADDGSPYIVMEYVEGRSLRQVLRDEAPLSAARSVALLDQVLAGLAEAHAHGVVHRDLKPSNVLVTPLKDGSEHCKVLDFRHRAHHHHRRVRPAPHPHRHDARHARLHGSGADQLARLRPPGRPLRRGRHPLRAAHRQPRLPRSERSRAAQKDAAGRPAEALFPHDQQHLRCARRGVSSGGTRRRRTSARPSRRRLDRAGKRS